MVFPLLAIAQKEEHFILWPDGLYRTEERKDFVVIPFENKTAHQIYQELASNVGSTFNNPSKVMSAVEDASIKIRAHSDDLIRTTMLGYSSLGGYYQLEFRIKDGRVRVSAPFVENEVGVWVGNRYDKFRFTSIVKKYFKNGKLKNDRRIKDYNIIVAKMNDVINNILYTSRVQEINENW